MKILATILVLLSTVLGFVFSYGYAYKEVSKMLYTPSEQTQPSRIARK